MKGGNYIYQKKTKTKKPFIFFMLIQNRNVNIDIFFSSFVLSA